MDTLVMRGIYIYIYIRRRTFLGPVHHTEPMMIHCDTLVLLDGSLMRKYIHIVNSEHYVVIHHLIGLSG